ncbi:MAG: hypothetical protein H5T47_01375 [Archaeoglobi archaeon]|nr:hypothetical protein [Candidatus Mnemosynella bozhongmuii]
MERMRDETEDLGAEVRRIHQKFESEFGPVYLSKYVFEKLVDLYREIRKEYGREIAEEEVMRKMMELVRR